MSTLPRCGSGASGRTGERTSSVGTGKNLGGIGTRIVIGGGPGVGLSRNLSPMPKGNSQQLRHVVHSGPQVTGRTNRSQTPQPWLKQREQQLTSSASSPL